jgi:hypothetical protein
VTPCNLVNFHHTIRRHIREDTVFFIVTIAWEFQILHNTTYRRTRIQGIPCSYLSHDRLSSLRVNLNEHRHRRHYCGHQINERNGKTHSKHTRSEKFIDDWSYEQGNETSVAQFTLYRSTSYEGESVNRSQMDTKRKICDIQTWKKHVFLDISSTNTDTFVPSLYQCVEIYGTEFFWLLSRPILHLRFNLFVISEMFVSHLRTALREKHFPL